MLHPDQDWGRRGECSSSKSFSWIRWFCVIIMFSENWHGQQGVLLGRSYSWLRWRGYTLCLLSLWCDTNHSYTCIQTHTHIFHVLLPWWPGRWPDTQLKRILERWLSKTSLNELATTAAIIIKGHVAFPCLSDLCTTSALKMPLLSSAYFDTINGVVSGQH